MCASNCTQLLGRFNLGQKIILRLMLLGFMAVGAYAIFLHSVAWAWIYLGVAILGPMFFVLPSLCSHCPYPHHLNDCLFVPAGIMKKLVKYRGPRVTTSEAALIGITLLLVIGIPQMWLLRHTGLLILFWAILLPFTAYFPLCLCKRCRHNGCPANRVEGFVESDLVQSYKRL